MTRKILCASLATAALAPAALHAATVEVVETYNLPAASPYAEPVTTITTTSVAPAPRVYYYTDPAPATTYYYATPAQGRTYPSRTLNEVYYESPSPIVVEAPPLTADQAITSDVVDRIASNPKISGRIGVETYDGNVELTGRVTNPRQAELAERDARSVDGVRRVDNELRTVLSR
jgi:hypothetical protein